MFRNQARRARSESWRGEREREPEQRAISRGPRLLLHPAPPLRPHTTHTPTQQYDTDVSTWSPQGRLFQVEYAMEAVKQGSCAVGLKVRRRFVSFARRRRRLDDTALPLGAHTLHCTTAIANTHNHTTPPKQPHTQHTNQPTHQNEKSDTHVVLATLKRSQSELASYQRKIFKVDDHLGIAIAGLTADGRILVRYMRNECINHRYI